MARRRRFVLAVGLSGAAGLALIAAERAFGAPRWRGKADSHFDGKRFRSIEPLDRGFSHFLTWMTHRERGPWRDFTGAPPGAPPPGRVARGLRVTLVNHSTVLVQMDGVNVLTDLIWSERASPVSWAGPRRRRSPGIRFEDLPPIDAVLVSHNHYDHMDLPTLRRLSAAHYPRIFVGLGNSAFLAAHGASPAPAIATGGNP